VDELLLDKGTDINAQGGKYGNALQAVSLNGIEKVIELLLDKSADVNAQGGYHGIGRRSRKGGRTASGQGRRRQRARWAQHMSVAARRW
jgi:hypothetical protein